jgi:hypothetical protein
MPKHSASNSILPGIIITTLWLPGVASADTPPPPTYVESCTRANQEAATEFCELRAAGYIDVWGCLRDPANTPPDRDACASTSPAETLMAQCCNAWITAGWAYRCKAWGATVFQTLWCRARRAGDPPLLPSSPPTVDPPRGCGAIYSSTVVPLVFLVAMSLLLWRSRRDV